MNEPKAFTFGLDQYSEDGHPCVVACDESGNPRLAGDEKFYLKSEADAVIDFWKNESHKHYERWFSLNKQYEGWFHKVMRYERAEREVLHQKYKRCLDKAKQCESEAKRLEAIAPIFENDKEWWEYNSDYWVKWQERWLALAERLKEGK